MKNLTVAQFSDWLESKDAVFMDDDIISFSPFEKDIQEAVYILDMDDDFPETLLEIDEDGSSIRMMDDGKVIVTNIEVRGDGSTYENDWVFRPLVKEETGQMINAGQVHVMKMCRETETIEDMTSYPDNKHGNDCAEEQFKFYCSESFSNWDEYSLSDVEACIENGYEQNSKWKVMIVHF